MVLAAGPGPYRLAHHDHRVHRHDSRHEDLWSAAPGDGHWGVDHHERNGSAGALLDLGKASPGFLRPQPNLYSSGVFDQSADTRDFARRPDPAFPARGAHLIG